MGKKNDILMEKYPLLRKNVMVYDNKKVPPLLINPYRDSRKKIVHLTKNELLLLHQFGGNRRVKDICHNLHADKKLVLDTLKKWCGNEWRLIKFLQIPLDKVRVKEESQAKYTNIYIQIIREMHSAREANKNSSVLKRYHKKEIRDALRQFDDRETTVSHIYKDPHVILGDKNYGASFADILMKNGVVRKGIEVLEIGGGTGIFARSFLEEISSHNPHIYKDMTYTIFELSPVLLKSQRTMLKKHKNITQFIQGDIESYDFKSEKFDLVISNEMIADLNTVRLKKTDIRSGLSLSKDKKRSVAFIKKYNLDISNAPRIFLFNLGAIELLLSIKKILKVKGKAYIVEYGSEWLYPRAVKLIDHTEYSIHFGFLVEAAAKLKMNPSIEPLINFLPFNKRIKVVNKVSFSLINDYLLPFLKVQKIPDDKVYTKEMLQKQIGWIFNHLSFVGFTRLGSGEARLDPSEFIVLEMGSD